MKQTIFGLLVLVILGVSSCTKCYTCKMYYTDENGNETHFTEEKMCVEKGQEDLYKYSANCVD